MQGSIQEQSEMPDKFDPYREALVMETETVWDVEYPDLSSDQRNQVETALHAEPENCASIEYIRVHTGFCRKTNVTQDDVERVL